MNREATANTSRVSPAELEKLCMDAMLKCGMSRLDSTVAADVLVTTDTWGVYSHGTKSLRQYLKRMCAGGLNSKAEPEILSQGPAWAIVDGHSALAMVTSCRAMDIAVQKAKTAGIAYVGVRNSCHFGAAGYYANIAAKAGLIGLVMSNVDPNMTIPGAKKKNIGSNPFAYAVPAGSYDPIFLDIALSAVAAGKIDKARFDGKKVPPEWLMDMDGIPTSDPGLYPLKAALAPVGGHKGYGLAVMVEILGAVVTGAGILSEVKSWVLEDLSKPTGQGHAFIAIDVASMMPKETFNSRMEQMYREIKDLPKAKDSDQIYLPGEIEWKKRREAMDKGMLLPDDVKSNLREMVKDLNMEMKEFLV